MSLTGMVYRPPYEANSLLLQVTQGCSHNKCTFCYMYPDVRFSICPMEQIEEDIEEAAHYCPDVERVFLEHGDAFVLSADRLIQIADAIAALINAVQPHLLFIGTLHAQPGCKLNEDMKNGVFKECTYGQLFDEQERLIGGLNLKEPLINSAARLTVPFPPFASCKFLDLPPVSFQNLQARLTKNSLVSQPPHLISVSLREILHPIC